MRRPLLALGAAAALALSMGCVSKSKYENAVSQLKKCQEAEQMCSADREKKAGEIAKLQGLMKVAIAERDEARAGKASADKLLADMETNLQGTKGELEELRKQRAEAEKRLAAFKALTAKFQRMIDTGKVKVVFRRGAMILKLPAGILFPSGKATLSEEGKVALADVAAILKTFGDRRFLVSGHTDNVPLGRSRHFRNNWQLSSERALTVTEYLIENGVSPTNLAAAGYGEFDPIADNTTDAGKQENRRIEIELLPNIEELPKLPE